MSSHRVLKDLFEAFKDIGPGVTFNSVDAATLTVGFYGQAFLIETEAAETRTLARPDKAGIVCAVVLYADGGDLTLTVTGGYNADADTTITFDDAGDFVRFMSIDVGGTYYWRVLGSEGTDVKTIATTIGDAVTAEHGAGAVGTGLTPATYRYTRDGVIITEIHIDLTGLKCKGDAAADAIGLTGAAYIGRYVTATYGIVFRIEMICVEAPGEGTATITADINLDADDEGDIAYDGAVDGGTILNTGGIAAGGVYINNTPAMTANDYIYLTEGDTAATTGVYNAGQVIVRLFGHPLLT